MNAIGLAVQNEVERRGFSVMTQRGGDGLGRAIREDPFVANYYFPSDSGALGPRLVLATEPVNSAGSGRSEKAEDGWTVRTADGAPPAHFEDTLVVTEGRPIVLTVWSTLCARRNPSLPGPSNVMLSNMGNTEVVGEE